MTDKTHNIGAHLRAFVERIERIEQEIGDLNADKKDIYAEAKSMGFDVKVLKKVVAERRKEPDARAEMDELFDVYWREVHNG